jgi:hypothetical protein
MRSDIEVEHPAPVSISNEEDPLRLVMLKIAQQSPKGESKVARPTV